MGLFDMFRRKPMDPTQLPAAVRVEDAVALVRDGALLVDVRENHEWKAGHAREAIHIPLGKITNSTGRLSKGRPVVVVCASGNRSRQGAKLLRSQGINATSLKGGMHAWRNAGGSLT